MRHHSQSSRRRRFKERLVQGNFFAYFRVKHVLLTCQKLNSSSIMELWEVSSQLLKVYSKRLPITWTPTILSSIVIQSLQERSVTSWTNSTEWERDKNHLQWSWRTLFLTHSFQTHGIQTKTPEPQSNSGQELSMKTNIWAWTTWKSRITNKKNRKPLKNKP